MKINVPAPILDGDEHQSNVYLLGGIHYNFLRKNPFIIDDTLYFSGLVTHKIANAPNFNLLFSYTFYGKPNFTPLVHEFHLGMLHDFFITDDLQWKYSIIRIQHTAHQFLLPSPTFQFEYRFTPKWSLLFSLLLNFNLASYYSPILPTRAEVSYVKGLDKVQFGFNFEETLMAKHKFESGRTLWQSGSRGLAFASYHRNIFWDFWVGARAGFGVDLITYFDRNGKEIEANSTGTRFFPLYLSVNLAYKP